MVRSSRRVIFLMVTSFEAAPPTRVLAQRIGR
jgi:hypothetical protein